MVSGIESNGLSQTIRALQAFRADEKIVSKKQFEPPQVEMPKMEKETPLREEISLQKANEIKELAQKFDMNISNSDINYAMTYGRSVIVDFSA